jgi:FkbM family methyltransferase
MMITTRQRAICGRILYRFATLGRKRTRVVRRGSITYELDLAEGLDLSLYLFGSFQAHVTSNRWVALTDHAVVVDIGANFGVMTLAFAKAFPAGRVIAFEPTHYAIGRLRRNLELNPELAGRVEVVQSFVSDHADSTPNLVAYASWLVDGSTTGREHPIHVGTPHSTDGVPSITLDEFVMSRSLDRLDLLKIDTEGHEMAVLRGAHDTIRKYRPVVIFEAGVYMMEERGVSFLDFATYFGGLDYSLFDAKTERPVSEANYRKLIPSRATTDLVAVPSEKSALSPVSGRRGSNRVPKRDLQARAPRIQT